MLTYDANSSLRRRRRSAGPSPNKQIGSFCSRRLFLTSESSVLTLIRRAFRRRSNSSINAVLSLALFNESIKGMINHGFRNKMASLGSHTYMSCSSS